MSDKITIRIATSLAQAIKQMGAGREPRIDVRTGNYVNGCSVKESHHADTTAIVAVGGNCATEIAHCWVSSHHKFEEQNRMLE